MKKPMTGVRVLEVAQYTFVPSAGAVLADWGADVIKIENPVTGDAQRGLVTVLGRSASKPGASFLPIIEAPNRGKRSVGLSLALDQTRPVFEELVRRSDVLLTSYLPQTRAKLRIDVDDVRRINPDIIYVAGSGFGARGSDRDTGAYDATAFWARGGSADGVTADEADTEHGGTVGHRCLAACRRRVDDAVRREPRNALWLCAAQGRQPHPGHRQSADWCVSMR